MEKPVDLLRVADLVSNPVWEFINDDSRDQALVRPVDRLPVSDLEGRVVGTQVMLPGGDRVWTLLGNVDVRNPSWTEHVITVSAERQGTWFMLARYHDLDYAERGPDALATFLGRSIGEVFPISYDLRPHVIGDLEAVVGNLFQRPRERLSRAEIIAMSVRRGRR